MRFFVCVTLYNLHSNAKFEISESEQPQAYFQIGKNLTQNWFVLFYRL